MTRKIVKLELVLRSVYLQKKIERTKNMFFRHQYITALRSHIQRPMEKHDLGPLHFKYTRNIIDRLNEKDDDQYQAAYFCGKFI